MTRRRFPPWLKKRLPLSGKVDFVRGLLDGLGLHTVCQSARCPNAGECFARGVATFMILGDRCTRNCRFCAVEHGAPLPVDPGEPARLAQAATTLGLRHVVVTSVTRDDLADGGADQFRRVILAVRERCAADVEVLTPDFRGDNAAIDAVALARPAVYNHNLETTPAHYAAVRPEADYRRSLSLLARVKEIAPGVVTKSGLMVGVGEKNEEILDTLRDLRQIGCEIVTIGQYLRPTHAHLPIQRFVTPQEFEEFARAARQMGFRAVASGPFVRSSYRAGELFRGEESQAEKARTSEP